MVVYNPFDNDKADARFFRILYLVKPLEYLEYLLVVFRINPDAVVLYAKLLNILLNIPP